MLYIIQNINPDPYTVLLAELKIVVKRLGNLKLRIRIQPDTNQFAESGSEIITQFVLQAILV